MSTPLVAVPDPPPALRLLPTPDWEPPYCDALGGSVPAHSDAARSTPEQGTLPLTFLLPTGIPAVPETPALRLVSSAATGSRSRASGDDDFFEPRTTSRSELPDPQFWGGRLAQAMLEVEAGVRPVTQLRRWTSDVVYARLRRRSHRARLVQTRTGQPGSGRVFVRTVRVCEPADGIAEVSTVVHDGARLRALAIRLEGIDGRWRCTALEHC